ncbi:MAG: hypothetical protein FWC43_12415, partial [Planctomycetaceae bacterium]|nr:hypothetical protein [Planctomycetaceae bacterium]
QVPQLFMAQWLAKEAEAARRVKQDVPVMVVMGNPPYNVSTQNKNDWIDGLIEDYKKEPGTDKKLKEQKLNLDDDYVKFIRYGQMLVDKNATGILAYITNHGFLDNSTFRGMRWSLLQSFDRIYVFNLHGSTTRNENVPEGSRDENVFDIKIGTSISICIKTGKKSPGQTAEVFYSELYGRRKAKYAFLREHTLDSVNWNILSPHKPFYFLVPKDFHGQDEYEKGFSVTELFPLTGPGIKTERDRITIHFTEKSLRQTIKDFLRLDSESIRDQFDLPKDSRDWKIEWAKKDLTDNISNDRKYQIQYRPFDFRHTYYTGKSRGFIGTPGYKTARHFLKGDNIGLVFKRGFSENSPPGFVSNRITDFRLWSRPGMLGGDFIAPLYLYPEADELFGDEKRKPNLNEAIIDEISRRTGLRFTKEKETTAGTFAPIDVLDYIYAVLHSPTYRERYKEFLKVDFPRVPYPEDVERFWNFVTLGEKLRRLHLMEGVNPQPGTANFPVANSNKVEKLEYRNGKIWINDTQFFDNVPLEAWNFYVGGYQPAQKWLKDRKGLTLTFDDIEHYQKIIHVLLETQEIMQEIDAV